MVVGELISLVGGRQQMKINSIHLIRRNSGVAASSRRCADGGDRDKMAPA